MNIKRKKVKNLGMKNKFRLYADAVLSFAAFYLCFSLVSKALGLPSPADKVWCVVETLLFQSVYLKKSEISTAEARKIADFKNALDFRIKDPFEYFFFALSKRYECEKKDGFIVVNGRVSVMVRVSSPLSYQSACEAYRNSPTDEVIILCLSAEKKALRILAALNKTITVWQEKQTVNLLSFLDSLPKKRTVFKRVQLKDVTRLTDARLSKKYLLGAIAIFSLATLSPYRTYYVVFAVLLLFVAVVPPLVKSAIG
jgi:hypothetical protein